MKPTHAGATTFRHPDAKRCPFCGTRPWVGPANPKEEGNAWGFVMCAGSRCKVRPWVRDGSLIADDRGTGAYIAQAIRRWNKRAP